MAFTLAVAGTLISCAPQAPRLIPRNKQPAVIASGVPLDVYAAVVRHQIESWELRAGSYCIKVEGKDAPPALLERLNSPKAKRPSACRQRTDRYSLQSIIDRQTKKQSVLFDVEKLRIVDDKHAEVGGGYYCANLCAASGTYYLELSDKGWTVTQYKIFFQS